MCSRSATSSAIRDAVRWSTVADRARTWCGKPDVYHALQATLLPRLPIAPSIAGALRDGLLS